jgi:tetratricopeptide (TPR) repeat protein
MKAGDALMPVLVLALGVGGVAWLQPSLAGTLHATKAREDVYAFPEPSQLKILTLGHRAAAADLLWVKVRIEYGIHWSERRSFRDAQRYLDAIVELDPAFESPYVYGDIMVLYQAVAGGEPEARWAKDFLERGTRERPTDAKLWAHYGQFLAFMAPTYIKDKPTLDRWRHDGAIALARSVDLGGDVAHSRTAAGFLSDAGERDAAIRALQNAYAVTDDPSEREHIVRQLAQYNAESAQVAAKDDLFYIERHWVTEYPFLGRGAFLVIAPKRDTLGCAGRSAPGAPRDEAERRERDCAATWQPHLPSAAAHRD